MVVADPNEGKPVAQFIVGAPLFVKKELTVKLFRPPLAGEALLTIPREIKRDCNRCGPNMNWRLEVEENDSTSAPKWVEIAATYQCRSCEGRFGAWIRWWEEDGKVVAMKFGEFPPPEIKPPKDVEKALGRKYMQFWRNGMILRNQGLGIGSLVYFRRMVEDATGELLLFIARSMEASGEPAEQVEAVKSLASGKTPFETKMKEAADLIPRSLRPGNANPFTTIFDVVSADLHTRTDEECCDLVDAISEAVALLLSGLNERLELLKRYEESVKKLEAARRVRGE